ncbi:hypothetical protein [Pseudomonas asiatica]|uniref:hypothetical protein n=1 Tax=Pseudomonas asiatica TaxID=2219225 RepID=UPI001FBBE264|nr:hypothetical protein [Pseudomonas asiatica]
MADLYGLRTRDASGVATLDTTITSVRSLKMMQVAGNGAFDQYISIPEIQAQSFVVVDALYDGGEYTSSPQAWYSTGQLQLRQPYTQTWQVMILSLGGELSDDDQLVLRELHGAGCSSRAIRSLGPGRRRQSDLCHHR